MAYGPAQAYPPQPGVPEGYGPGFPAVTGVNPHWLASSADRERTVGVLRAGFAEGRLTQDELNDRVGRAYAARTYEQLWALTADLPTGPLPVPTGPHAAMIPVSSAPPSSWRPAAALIITALVIFTLAALITAVITAHTQQFVYTPFQQPANLPVNLPVMHVPIAPPQISVPGQ